MIYMIPKIVHFINIGPREFNFVHYLSIMSAIKMIKPEKIYVYYEFEQNNNYWNILKNFVTFEKIIPPKYHKGIRLDSYQYQADIIRMEKLLERGGIYLDLDVICLKSFDNFLDKNIVMGIESNKDNNDYSLESANSLTNAVIISEKNNKFLKYWYDNIGSNLLETTWAYHAVCLPLKLLTSDVNIVSRNTFMPFSFYDSYIFDGPIDRIVELVDCYTIHLWETIWKDKISLITPKYFDNNHNIFTILFRKYVTEYHTFVEKYIESC